MKKIIALLGILTVCGTFFACKDVSDETEKLSVEAKNDCNNIAVPAKDNASYINIFRCQLKDDGTIDNETIQNIGEILPVSGNTISFNFSDTNFDGSYQYGYSYLARYRIKNAYVNTGWSDPVYSGRTVSEVSVVVDNAYFTVDLDKTSSAVGFMTLCSENSGSISLAKTGYRLCLAIANSSSASTFILVNTLATDDTPVELETSSASISLTSLLNTSYLNTPLTLIGVVGEKVETYPDQSVDEPNPIQYKTIYWTAPTKIELVEINDASKKDISSTGDFEIDLNTASSDDFDITDTVSSSSRTLISDGSSDFSEKIDY